MKPLDANILYKFIKAIGGHLTYALKDKKTKTFTEAKEIAMEVEENLRISKMDANDHPNAKIKVKKGKSKDQHEEILRYFSRKWKSLVKK